MEGNELDESDNSNLSDFANSSADDDHNNSSKYDSSSSKDQGGLASTAVNERIRRWEKLENSESESSDQEDIIYKHRFRRTARLGNGLAEDFNMKHYSSSSDNEEEMESSTLISSPESESSPKKCLSQMTVKQVTQKRDPCTHLADSRRSDDSADSGTDQHPNHETNSMTTDDHVHIDNQDSDESTLADGQQIPPIDTMFDCDSESSGHDSDTAIQSEENNSESSDSNQESDCELNKGNETSSETENQDDSSEEDLSEGERPVCKGTSIKGRTFEATFLALSHKHSFSKSTRTDILKFLKLFIPEPNLPSSNYKFEKMLIEAMDIHYSKFELCVSCSTTLNEGKCTNGNCMCFNRKLNDHEIELCYFIPIKGQLKRILTEHWGKIKDYKTDHVHGHGLYNDICCGSFYQSEPGKDNPQQLISLVYHIDGAPAVKSKSMNLWPIQCFVVELPPTLSPKKPDLKVFQERFVNELEQLQNSQVKLEVDSTNISIERIALHGHLADLVAKAPSLCFCQFNGKNGCSVCLHPGERIQKGKGSIRIYPFINQDPPRRTHMQTLLHARTAERTGKSVFGIKGVSPLLRVLEVPTQVFLDYMHLVLAGGFLRRMNIWLNHQSNQGFLSECKDQVDEAMMNIKFPHDFNRKLRPLSELKRWKDRELQNLFLHASLPVLKPFFPDEYFCHFALLVTAIRLLTNDVITDGDIAIAKLLIRSYQRLMSNLYGETEQTYTCHALGHLPDQVQEHGPLILHSSFVFEAMISHLKRQFHGTRGIVAQIVKNLLLAQNSGSMIKKETKEPAEVRSFIDENIMPKKDKGLHKIGEKSYFFLPFKNNPNLPNSVVQWLDLEEQQVHQASRLFQDDQVFHSLAYTRKGKSCSYIVQFQEDGNNEFGIVQYFLLVRNTGFAVVHKFEKKGSICSSELEEQDDLMVKSFIEKDILGKHFQAVEETSSDICIPCCDIVCRCVFVSSESAGISGYVSPVLKYYQHD